MANTLGYFNPAFYANEALILLENALGMSGRVHRGYESERNTFGKGDTVNIKKPSTFTAQDSGSSAQDLTTGGTTITLNRHKEVLFKVTEKELTLTTQQLIDIHIQPAAYALANELDAFCCEKAAECPWFFDLNASPGSVVGDVTGPRQVMFDNGVPMDPSRLHYMVNGTMEANLLGLAAFSQWQGSAQAGVTQQQTGTLSPRYGFNFFANQNVQSFTKGTCSVTTLYINGAVNKGVATLAIDNNGGAVTGTLKRGDTFVIAGNTQRYAVTATATASGNAFATVTITPPLAANAADNAVITLRQDDHTMNLAFHRNFMGLVVVPITDIASQLGAKVTTVYNDKAGIGLRARMWYDGYNINVGLDMLYGGTVLDPNLACRACG